MSSETPELFSRQELMGGLRAKRASMLLFAIESRTGYLMHRAHEEVAVYLTQTAVRQNDQAFLQAIGQGRDLPINPAIRDLEHYAAQWADLVPADPGFRAALARLIGEKYLFTYGAVPHVRQALGLDDQAVSEAYQRAYGQPLASIYAQTITAQDQLRWTWARVERWLEHRPPFWIAFMLTLPGAPGLLALPIALSSLGFAAGLALVLLFGVVNIITAAALAETVARSGTARFGLGFLGQLVQEYLGGAGSLLLTAVLAANTFLVLIVFFLGVSSTLTNATQWPAELWTAALFGVCLYFLSRRSLNSTVSSAMLIVFAGIVMLLLIPLLALPYFQVANLTRTNPSLLAGSAFSAAALGPVVGIMLSTFFSHFLIATYAPVVLRRDPSARSWIRGSIAAIVAYMAIACLWMVAVNGALSPEVLAKTSGTVVEPLADLVGPSVRVLGSLLVVLSLGLACVQVSLGLYYQVQERLPAAASGTVNSPDQRLRFLLSIAPTVLAFIAAEWLSLTSAGSFTDLLGAVSAMSLPLLGGIFPVLLLAATRRKGDFVPAVVYRFLGNRILLAAIYLFFLASIFAHGLFIWQTPLLRAFALAFGGFVFAVTLLVLRGGALDPRLVIELRQDERPGEQDVFNVTVAGQPAVTQVTLEYPANQECAAASTGRVPAFAQLESATFSLPNAGAREIKVWPHRMLLGGNSEGLPVVVELQSDGPSQVLELKKSAGPKLIEIDRILRQIRITLGEGAHRETNHHGVI